MNPKISIVMASYNSVNTIEFAINSILQQTYDNYELIIIDGGSADGTVDILKKYDEHISYWSSGPDKGLYDALNKGVSNATGDYVQIIGSDDSLYSPNTLSGIVKYLDSNIDILSCCGFLVDEKLNIEHYLDNEAAKNDEHFKHANMVPHPGMYVKTDIMREHPFDISYKIAADYEFLLYCYMRDGIQINYINSPVFYFSNSGISSTNKILEKQELIRIWTRYGFTEKINEAEKAQEREKRFSYRWKKIRDRMLEKVGMLAEYRCKCRGWRTHKCEFKTCRWCSDKESV